MVRKLGLLKSRRGSSFKSMTLQAEENYCLLSSLGSLLSTYSAMKAGLRGAGFQVIHSWTPLSPVYKVRGVFNNRGLFSISGKQPREAAIAITGGRRGAEN